MTATSTITLSDYLNKCFVCSCGHTHSTTLEHIEISEDAHNKLLAVTEIYGYKNIFLFADDNTYNAAGSEIAAKLKDKGYNLVQFVFHDDALIPDEKSLGSLLTAIQEDCELIIAAGTGTINDLGKYISHKLKLPYFIVATAPSMDGFASNVSCLMINHMKTTVVTHVPQAVFADTRVLAKAPPKMIAAGAGDILGKYICLLDWKLSNIITGEYHCSYVEDLVRRSVQIVAGNVDSLASRDVQAVKSIMEALVLSGIAMSYIGNSRPASGSEHHLSHYWELSFIAADKPAVLHGIKVGIGTVEASMLYELLLETAKELPDIRRAVQHADSFSLNEWSSKMKDIYGSGSDEVISLEVNAGKNNPDNVKDRINIISQKWGTIKNTIEDYLPSSGYLITLLKQAGSAVKPCDEGISPFLVCDAILYAKEIRNRYGLLQLLFDLGYDEEFAVRREAYWHFIEQTAHNNTECSQVINRR